MAPDRGSQEAETAVDAFTVFLELSCCLIESFDLIAVIVNGLAWFKSEPNRKQRREARAIGAEPPPTDFWFQLFVFTTPIVLTLTGIIVFKWVRWLLS